MFFIFWVSIIVYLSIRVNLIQSVETLYLYIGVKVQISDALLMAKFLVTRLFKKKTDAS
jgi:hypothetical protein